MNIETLKKILKRLRLNGLLATLEQRLGQAREDALPHIDFLGHLLQDEVQRREGNNFVRRLKNAKFEEQKVIEDLDTKRYPQATRQVIHELATSQYVRDKKNLIIMGPTGTGKTHLAQALGHKACINGYSVHFIRATELFKKLRASRADDTWDVIFKDFMKPHLLILDDFGLKTLTEMESDDMYELILQRNTKGSLIITSNRRVDAWVKLFSDPVMANAALDRVANKAYHLILEGDSYRVKERPQFDPQST